MDIHVYLMIFFDDWENTSTPGYSSEALGQHVLGQQHGRNSENLWCGALCFGRAVLKLTAKALNGFPLGYNPNVGVTLPETNSFF